MDPADLDALAMPVYSPPVAAQAAKPSAEEEKKEEEDDDPNRHRLEYEGIEMKKTDDGKKILNGFLTFEEKIGEGAFCRVLKAIGYYPKFEEYVPYAMKEFRMATLN